MTIIAYHFCGDTLRDGRPIPPDGEWLAHDGPVVMCESGLHASRHPFDALQYAPGPILCRVECADVVDEEADKLVCRRRRIITRIDATELCRQAARRYALDVLHLWEDAPQVVRDYLTTGDDSIRAAARDAAWAAARDAARAAARAAARDAARDAARAAARDAARDAAWAAAWAALSDAASDAARAAAWAAARDAAWAAAWDAARDAQERDLAATFKRITGGEA